MAFFDVYIQCLEHLLRSAKERRKRLEQRKKSRQSQKEKLFRLREKQRLQLKAQQRKIKSKKTSVRVLKTERSAQNLSARKSQKVQKSIKVSKSADQHSKARGSRVRKKVVAGSSAAGTDAVDAINLKTPPNPIKVGEVTHYFAKIAVAVVRVTNFKLSLGDRIGFYVQKHWEHMRVESMQVESKDVKVAKKGQLVGLKVSKPVKISSEVYVFKQE